MWSGVRVSLLGCPGVRPTFCGIYRTRALCDRICGRLALVLASPAIPNAAAYCGKVSLTWLETKLVVCPSPDINLGTVPR